MNELKDYLTKHAEHQVLKYAASKHMFCPVSGCGKILDYKKTVVIEFTFGNSIVMCSKCFDSEPVQKQMRIFKDKIKEVTRYRKV